MIAGIRSEVSVNEAVLFVAFELGKKPWKLGMTTGLGMAPWVRSVPSGDLEAVAQVLAAARARFGLPVTARVLSCYEAGRDGFWIHRALRGRGIENRVVDSSSIAVNRRKRRAKSDRLDAQKLVILLERVCFGDRGAWSEVRVPTAAAEAARHRSRERTALTQEQTRLRNQIGSWLATAGCVVSPRRRQAREWWTLVRDGANEPLPAAVHERIARAERRVALVAEQIAVIETAQAETTAAASPTSPQGRLVQLKGSRRRAPRCGSTRAWSGGSFRIGASSAGYWALRRSSMNVATRRAIKGSVGPATIACNRRWCSSRGAGSSGHRRARCRSGISRASEKASGRGKSASSRSRANSLSRCGDGRPPA